MTLHEVLVTTIKVDPPTTPRPKPDNAWTRSAACQTDPGPPAPEPGPEGTNGWVRVSIELWKEMMGYLPPCEATYSDPSPTGEITVTITSIKRDLDLEADVSQWVDGEGGDEWC